MGVAGIVWLGIVWQVPGVFDRLTRRRPLIGLACICIPWIVTIVIGRLARREIHLSGGRLLGVGRARAGTILGTSTLVVGVVLAGVEFSLHLPEHNVRGVVSRARTDMRSLSLAIEAYYVDNNIYPPWGIGNKGPGGTQTYNYSIASQQNRFSPPRSYSIERARFGPFLYYRSVRVDGPADLPGFLLNGPGPQQRFGTLTTPLGYVSAYPSDLFSRLRGATFVYWSIFPGQPDPSDRIGGKDSPLGGVGWILVSPGPDLKYDIAGEWDVYNPAISQPSYRLLSGTNKKGRALTYDPTNGIISDGDIWRVKQ
jgi:hypothetical protein